MVVSNNNHLFSRIHKYHTLLEGKVWHLILISNYSKVSQLNPLKRYKFIPNLNIKTTLNKTKKIKRKSLEPCAIHNKKQYSCVLM